MPSTTPRNYISALYVATFNRAPDKAGLTYWENQFAANPAIAVRAIAANFTQHPAFTTLYGGLNNLDFVSAIYVNVLGGPGDAAGIIYWNGQLTAGLSRADFLAAFVESALTVDINSTNFPNLSQAELDAAVIRQDYLTNKAEVGLFFADTLGSASNLDPTTDPNSLVSLENDPAYQASVAILGGVTNNDSSVLAAEQLINTAVTQPDPTNYIIDHALLPPGETFVLTPNQDTINASSPNAGDVVTGVVDGLPIAIGGSTYTNGDIVNGNGNTIVELTVQNLIPPLSAAAVATLNNIHDVNIIAGTSGVINFNAVNWSSVGAVNLDRGTDGLSVFVDLLEDGTDLSIASGVSGSLSADYTSGLEVDLFAGHNSAISWIDGDVDATVAASESATFTAFMPVGDVTVGDINATVGQNGFFGAFVSASQSGDISVGDVTVAAGVGASVSVSVSNNDGGSVTVGDVSMLGGTSEFFGVFNNSATGDVLVGDVSMSVSATGSLFLSVSNSGTTGESLGSLTVGNIDLTLDHDSTGSVNIFNNNSYTTDGLSLGALTVGDMTIALGRDSSFDVSISQFAGGSTANVLAAFGDVAIGNLDATVGTNTFFSYDIDVENSLSGDIASVEIGDVTLALADGASVSYSASVTADEGDITSFVMGDVVVDMGVSASINEFDIFLNANNGGNIGTVVIGDLTANIGVSADFDDYSLDISASNGTIDSVAVGNVSAVVADNGSFSYSATISAEAVGDVTFGDIDLTSHGASSLSAQIFVDAFSGDVGSVTVGDINLVADNSSTAFFSVSVSASADAGVLNVGNISFDTTANAFAEVSLTADGLIDGDINIAGVSFNGSDSVFFDGSNLSVSGSGDVSLGDLSVGLSITGITGTLATIDLLTHGVAGLFANVSSTGDVSLDSVDYSGLVLDWAAGNPDAGNGVTINLSTYSGDTNVIASDYNDTIFDNTGVNQLTGGDGADLFIFDPANTGKTLATMDQVRDFAFNSTTPAAGDLLDVGVIPNVATYAEQGGFTDFAAYNTAANAANKEVFVGALGNDLIVAVDAANDGNVDFMIQLVGLNLGQVDIAAFV